MHFEHADLLHDDMESSIDEPPDLQYCCTPMSVALVTVRFASSIAASGLRARRPVPTSKTIELAAIWVEVLQAATSKRDCRPDPIHY